MTDVPSCALGAYAIPHNGRIEVAETLNDMLNIVVHIVLLL